MLLLLLRLTEPLAAIVVVVKWACSAAMLGLVLLVNAGIHRTMIRCAEIGTTGSSEGESAAGVIAELLIGDNSFPLWLALEFAAQF